MKKILTKFNGLHYRQEYLCLAKESLQRSIHAYLVIDRQVIKDITNSHVFTGYSPLMFTLTSSDLQEPLPDIEIFFSQQSLEPNDFFEEKESGAEGSDREIGLAFGNEMNAPQKNHPQKE